MRSMLRLRSVLLTLLVLSMALGGGCCKKSPEPVRPVTVVPRACVTPEMKAARPKPIAETLMACLDQGNSPYDCVAHDARTREAYIVRLLANCGGGK